MVTGAVILNFVLFGLGVPIFIAFGLGSALALMFCYQVPISNVARIMFASIDKFTLLAAPLFILLGSIATGGGVGKRLINFSSALFGHLPGGLLVATIAFCTVFAAISGSGLAAIAAVGTIMFPELRRGGYSVGISSGAIASGGQLGILIPPSIFFIIVGMLMQVSAADLFAAGLFPGLLMAAGLCVIAILLTRKENVRRIEPASWKVRGITFIKAVPVILLAVIILGGIYTGFFTPTEAATVACVYAAFLGFVIYRELNWRKLLEALAEAALTSGAIYLLIGGVSVFSQLLSRAGVSAALATRIVEAGLGPLAFVGLLNVFILVISFFIDPWALMFMIIPVLMPTFAAFQLDLIWVGVMMCIGTMIGYLTPPMAPGLYFASRVLKVPAEEIAKGLIPYLFVMALVIPIVMFLPQVATWLPGLL